MKVPQRKILEWSKEILDQCAASRAARISAGATWRSYYLTGSDGTLPATYNKCWAHIDEISSYLYSPSDVRFSIEFDKTKDEAARKMGDAAASILSADFHRRQVDIAVGEAVDWALVKGSTFIKLVQAHNGIQPWVIQPEMIGALREDIDALDDRQEAFVHTTFVTPSVFANLIESNPSKEKIQKKMKGGAKRTGDDPARDDMFKQVIIGGVNPVSTTGNTNPAGGLVRYMSGPNPTMSPHTVDSLIRIDELWVVDDKRQDWTTIQIADECAVIFGDLTHQNILSAGLPSDKRNMLTGVHPFVRMVTHKTQNYLFGRSELAGLFLLQDTLNRRFAGVERMLRLQEDPPNVAIGASGMTDERWAAANRPGGFIAEENPNAKITSVAPALPDDVWADIRVIQEIFDDIGGMPPTMRGRGESGVRSQAHAETLVRTGAPRLRDRALIVENNVAALGELQLSMLQAYDPTPYPLTPKDAAPSSWLKRALGGEKLNPDMPAEFLLSQLPDDCHVGVDSHSASPAFSEESARKAFELAKVGAIAGSDLIRAVHPEREDYLAQKAEQKEESQAALMSKIAQTNPEALLHAGGGGKKR